MVPRRTLATLVAAALVLAPGVASAGFPVVIYPFRVPGLNPAQKEDLHAILAAGLASASRRGILSPRTPVLSTARCGERPSPACLADAAAGGLVLSGRGEVRPGFVLITAALWDATGTRSREVRFIVDLVIQNLRPVGESLMELELEVEPDGRVTRDVRAPPSRDPRTPSPEKRPAVAAVPVAPPAPAAPAVAAPAPASGAAAAARIEIAEPADAPPRLWKRKAGPWLTGVGVALLAGGAAVGYLNRDLADDLDAKYARGTLGAGDRTSYDRVRTFNVLSTALFAAGGAATAAGTWMWISAPSSPGKIAAAGVGGRF